MKNFLGREHSHETFYIFRIKNEKRSEADLELKLIDDYEFWWMKMF